MRLKKTLSGIATAVLMAGCAGPEGPGSAELTQEKLDEVAKHMDVNYRVVENRGDGRCTSRAEEKACHIAQLTLRSPVDLNAKNWAIYFGLRNDPVIDVKNEAFAIEHLNGDFHRLVPTEKFSGLSAGESTVIEFVATGLVQSESVLLPNYYIVAADLEPRVIESTQVRIDPETGMEVRPYVTPLTNPKTQFKSSSEDLTQWPTSSRLYEENASLAREQVSVDGNIIPTPKRMVLKAGRLDLADGIALQLNSVNDSALRPAMERLAQLGVTQTEEGVPVTVTVAKSGGGTPEAYELRISNEGVVVQASDTAGALYGLQSLASLIVPGKTDVPYLEVSDEPFYRFRGLHIDVSRNFHSKELLLRVIDQMGAYKLNKLHLHLGDDEGWRVEIPGLPELTDIASKRCHDPSETTCLLPTLGSGPDTGHPLDGYYAVSDYVEIVKAADKRNIQVIPSFDMPGHSRAAIKAMEARYKRLMDEGQEQAAKEFLLTDPDDTTVYQSIQSYNDNTINVCMDSTFNFISKVIDEVQAMHEAAGQRLTRYHVGADETAGAWVESPACRRFLAENDYGVETIKDLNGYFVERVVNMLAAEGIEVAGWHDGISKADPARMPKVQTNVWTPIYEGAKELAGKEAEHDWLSQGAHEAAHQQANYGWDVVLSTPEALYFDFPYSADPKEHGQNWGMRELSTRDVFNFMPDNLPAHAEFGTNKLGHPYTIDDRIQRNAEGEVIHRPREKGKRFAGIQAQIWSETLRSDALVEYMLFPRMLALAERAWHHAEWAVPYDYDGALYSRSTNAFTDEMRAQRDAAWNIFASALAQKVMPKLDLANIQYRIPPVGAKIEDGVLKANVALPGLAIEYRVNGKEWNSYQGPIEVRDGIVEVRAISPDGERKGRTLRVM